MDTLAVLENAWQDFLYALRTFRWNKAFFAIATLSLALGIGANTAIFQLLDAVRLRMLPVAHADQLVELRIKDEHCCSGNFSDRHPNFTYAQWEQIRDHQQAFSSIFAWGDNRFNLTQSGEPRFAEGLWVSGDFFKALTVKPLMGRLIDSNEDRPGCGSPGVVISYAFWQREFGGDPSVLGKQVSLDGHRLDIAGVTPANFFGVEVGRSFDVAVPVCAEPLIEGDNSHMSKRHHWWLAIIGRLKPDWNLTRASAQMKSISPAVFETTVPPNYRPDQAKYYAKYKLEAKAAGAGVSSLREDYQQPLLVLLGIAALVLLIACSNLANLMLARASTREREMAVRLAIGANRARLIRQLLVESLALTIIGAALGGFLAQFLSGYLATFLSTGDNPVFIDLALDWRVLSFTAGVTVLTCLLFGLTPALRATRTHPASAMKAAGRGLTADRQRFGLRRALVICQVALSLVLMAGALLFVRSLRNLLTLDAGFNRDRLLITAFDASRLNLSPERRNLLYRELLDGVRNTPGIEQAANVRIVPISGSGWNDSIEFLGKRTDKPMLPWFNRVSAGYFRTLGTPILAGRDFDAHDTTSSPEVAIVNEEFCNKFLGKTNPLGKQFRILTGPGEAPHVYQIIGRVKNSKYRDLREAFQPNAFVAETQQKESDPGFSMVIRSAVPLGSLMPTLKKTIVHQSAGISFQFHPFNTQVQNSLLRERLMATLSGFFGFLAAALATVGLYGVISYMVARRRSEIGVRIALGARGGEIVKLVLKEAVLLLVIGLVIGVALAMAMGRTASSLLYGLEPTDPSTMAGAIAALALVAMAASFVPALRASRVQPMVALREE
jgi:predicted permease